jgi:hypothetical protein
MAYEAQPSQFRVLTSAARTATNSTGIKRPGRNLRGVRVYIEVTAVAATPSVVFNLQFYDTLNAQWHTALASAAVTATGRTMLELYPEGAAVANARATYHVGTGFRVNAVHADADSITYNIVGEWLP